VIPIGHARPAEDANWLPAPSSHFYLILRLYHPSEAFGPGSTRFLPCAASAEQAHY
jgi:hypothetical protein